MEKMLSGGCVEATTKVSASGSTAKRPSSASSGGSASSSAALNKRGGDSTSNLVATAQSFGSASSIATWTVTSLSSSAQFWPVAPPRTKALSVSSRGNPSDSFTSSTAVLPRPSKRDALLLVLSVVPLLRLLPRARGSAGAAIRRRAAGRRTTDIMPSARSKGGKTQWQNA